MKIAIIGSNHFWKEMREFGKRIEEMGHEVQIPFSAENKIPREHWYNMKEQDIEQFIDVKDQAMKKYFDKIRDSNAILVLNFDKNNQKGYIGGNTLMEMAVAFDSGKHIFLLQEVPANSNFYDEIISMKPKIINSNLEMIGANQ